MEKYQFNKEFQAKQFFEKDFRSFWKSHECKIIKLCKGQFFIPLGRGDTIFEGDWIIKANDHYHILKSELFEFFNEKKS